MSDPTPTPPLWRDQPLYRVRPLWRVMDDELPGPDYNSAHWAPVLRAVADAVDAHFDDDYIPLHTVVFWLRSEATRAEAGEQ